MAKSSVSEVLYETCEGDSDFFEVALPERRKVQVVKDIVGEELLMKTFDGRVVDLSLLVVLDFGDSYNNSVNQVNSLLAFVFHV